MPTYEYRCPNGHSFELFQRISDPLPEACEVCGASPVERVLYPVAVHFKGSGFYNTDYGKGGKKRDAPKEGDGAPEKKDSSTGTEKAASASTSSSDSAAA